MQLDQIYSKNKNTAENKQRNYCFFSSTVCFPYLCVFGTVLHNILPLSIYCLKETPLFWHLLHNILRRKNGFQIKPLCLHFQPFINYFLNVNQAILPFLNKYLKNVTWIFFLFLFFYFSFCVIISKRNPQENTGLLLFYFSFFSQQHSELNRGRYVPLPLSHILEPDSGLIFI